MEHCLEGLHRDGFGLLRGIVRGTAVERLRESISATVRDRTTATSQGYVGGLLRYNRDIASHLAARPIIDVCEALFGPHARISSIAGTVHAPGTQRGELHVDWPHKHSNESCIRQPLGNTVAHLVTFWMLTDFTLENGATIILPGSHRALTEPEPIEETEVRLLGRAGDVGLMDARTWHAVAPNLSQRDRVAVVARYAPWWLNLSPLRRGSCDRRLMIDHREASDDPYVEPLTAAQFEALPPDVQPLLEAMVARDSR